MKPLNQNERMTSFWKFLASGVLLMSIYGFSIYAYTNVNKIAEEEVIVDDQENQEMDYFLKEAKGLVKKFRKAENDIDRNGFTNDMNELINAQKGKFSDEGVMFSNISEQFIEQLRLHEKINEMGSTGDEACDERIETLEDKIEDLERDLEDAEGDKGELVGDCDSAIRDCQDDFGRQIQQKDRQIKQASSKLNRIGNNIATIADDFASRDWCKGLTGKKCKEEIKAELKGKLNRLHSDIIEQASNLN